uniref:ubiquitinyl hydrolase 1 n=2 Tax=Rhinopithecus bieti TaxID=61621 RepID=A0A2K6LYK8_RHIBE
MAEDGGRRERPDAETQKSELGALMRTTLQRGAQWYLIDSRWFKQWKKYVGFDSWDMYNVGEHNLFPGPIDNSGLFSDPESQTLKEHLIDELDYVLVPTEAWNKLLNWYGCVEGQQPIVRKVVEHGLFVKHCKVEVYLLELKLCENSDPTNVLSCHFSKADTIATIEKEMRKLFNIPAERETRLWNKYMSNTYEQLSKLDNTVQDAGLYQGQVLVIEPQNEDGTWPRQTLQSKRPWEMLTQQGVALQKYNNKLVRCVEELCQKQEELCRQIQQEEDEKQRLQNEVRQLAEKLACISENLTCKTASLSKFYQTIAETEATYLKMLESSQTLLSVLKREAGNLTKATASGHKSSGDRDS